MHDWRVTSPNVKQLHRPKEWSYKVSKVETVKHPFHFIRYEMKHVNRSLSNRDAGLLWEKMRMLWSFQIAVLNTACVKLAASNSLPQSSIVWTGIELRDKNEVLKLLKTISVAVAAGPCILSLTVRVLMFWLSLLVSCNDCLVSRKSKSVVLSKQFRSITHTLTFWISLNMPHSVASSNLLTNLIRAG